MRVSRKASTGVPGLSVGTGGVVGTGEAKTLIDILSKISVRLLSAVTSKKVIDVANRSQNFIDHSKIYVKRSYVEPLGKYYTHRNFSNRKKRKFDFKYLFVKISFISII